MCDEEVILLTGSTGSLGTYLLHSLLVYPRVKRVYALNQKREGRSLASRQSQAFSDRGLDPQVLDDSRLILMEVDLAKDYLGLAPVLYDELKTVTTIIHNAWRLDFNLGLSSFESHVQGTHNLAALALQSHCRQPPQFIFMSSIGSLSGWENSDPVPEELVQDPEVALGYGYSESKWVAEQVRIVASPPESI